MLRKSVFRALFVTAAFAPILGACSGGSIVDPDQNCVLEPETMQYVCYER